MKTWLKKIALSVVALATILIPFSPAKAQTVVIPQNYTIGDMIYASATKTLSKLGIGSNGTCMSVSGGLPAWVSCLITESGIEAVVDLQDLQGAVTDAQVPNTITVDLATSASDLTCTNCIGATEIDGASLESEIEAVADLQDFQGAVTDGQVPNNITVDLATSASDLTCTDCIGATEITDVYVLNSGDNITGEFLAGNGATLGGIVSFLEGTNNGSNKLSLVAPASITSNQTCNLENDASFIPDSCVGDGVDSGGGDASYPIDLTNGSQVTGTWTGSDFGFTYWNGTNLEKLPTDTFFTDGTNVYVGDEFWFNKNTSDGNFTFEVEDVPGSFTVTAEVEDYGSGGDYTGSLPLWEAATTPTPGNCVEVGTTSFLLIDSGDPCGTGGGGTPTDITVADTTDSTAFVALFESATGDLGPKTDAGLTYNATTGMLTATGLTGPLTGNASTASALAANPSDCSSNQFATTIAANGNLTCASIVDADIPNTITIDTATLASTVTVVDGTDATSFPAIFDSATGSLAVKTDGGLLYDASNGTLSSTIFNTPTLTLTGTGTLNGLDAIDSTSETTLEAAIDIAGDVTGTGLGSVVVASNAVALATDTTGNYVADLTAGTAIDVSGGGAENATITVDVDTTEVEATTWGAGGNASNAWTYNLSGTDPVLTAVSGGFTMANALTINAAGMRLTGSSDGDLTMLAIGDGTGDNDEDLTWNLEDVANTVGLSSSTGVTEFDLGTIDLNTDTIDLTGTGTINGLDAIDGTTETTLEAALDLVGDVSSTGLSTTVIGADKILESMLKAVDTAVDEECLTFESTVGDFEWQSCGAGGSTTWDSIGDASGLGSVDFAGFDQDIISSEDGGDILTITDTDADQASDSTILRLATNDTNDTNTYFVKGTTDEDGTPALDWAVKNTGTTGGLAETLGSAGVSLTTDGDGAITFLGLGNGSDEDLTLNLDDTSNTGVFSSSTSLATLNFSSISLQSSGVAIPTISSTDTLTNKTIAAASNVVDSCIPVSVTNDTSSLTTGTKKTFNMPYAMTVTSVRASLVTAATGGTLVTVDINEAGTTILSTKITLDASEKTSVTAATAPVISDSALADDAIITIDIDAVGNTTPGNGLGVSICGTI